MVKIIDRDHRLASAIQENYSLGMKPIYLKFLKSVSIIGFTPH